MARGASFNWPRGRQQRVVQAGCFFAALALALAFDARHRQACFPREFLDGFRKRLAAVLHEKPDCGAMRAAPEAVIELLSLADGERGRFFPVKRAARNVVRAGLLERHITVDHFDDVDARQQRFNEIVRDHQRRGG
jgi:hypothetical protein